MKRTFESLSGNRRRVAATLAVSIVIGVQVAQRTISLLLDLSIYFAQRSAMDSMPSFFSQYFLVMALGIAMFALGFFLCLWLLAPIGAELRLLAVLGRSLLATGGGTAVLFVSSLLGALLSGFDESAGLVFGWAYGALATATSNIGWAVSQAVYTALSTAISVAPLAVLAGVLVWLWLRAHPVSPDAASDTGKV